MEAGLPLFQPGISLKQPQYPSSGWKTIVSTIKSCLRWLIRISKSATPSDHDILCGHVGSSSSVNVLAMEDPMSEVGSYICASIRIILTFGSVQSDYISHQRKYGYHHVGSSSLVGLPLRHGNAPKPAHPQPQLFPPGTPAHVPVCTFRT
jgi:hypothetical protein